MKEENVLALDISTKTGWAAILSSADKIKLIDYGQLEKVSCPENESYPGSYVSWAYKCYNMIEKIIEEFQPNVLIIEEVTKSKNAMSQKILDYIHFLVAKFIQETGIKNIYLQTGVWRSVVGSYMNKEERQRNKEVREYKKKNKSKIAYDIRTGKRIGIIGKKHVTIRLINDNFKDQLKIPLKRKDEDIADGIALGWAYHLMKLKDLKNG